MKLSTKGRYALRAIVDLAEQLETGKKYVSIKEIAQNQDISIKYLESIFISLKKAGIVQSRRGAWGGYYLGKPADRLNALEVVEAVEGPVLIVECCRKDYGQCDIKPQCKTFKLWDRINQSIIDNLSGSTIADLV